MDWQEDIKKYIPITFERQNAPRDYFLIKEKRECSHLIYSSTCTGIYSARTLKNCLSLQEDLFMDRVASKPWRVIIPQGVDVDHSFLMPISERGFNSVVLSPDQELAISRAKDYELKVILKPVIPDEIKALSPFERGYEERVFQLIGELQKQVPSYEGIYWESIYFTHPCSQQLLRHSKLRIELFIKELEILEKMTPLFYAFPEIPCAEYRLTAEHYTILENHAGPSTQLIFPVYDGQSSLPHLNKSPFFHVCQHHSLPVLSLEHVKGPFLFLDALSQLADCPSIGACVKISHPLEKADYSLLNIFLCGEVLWRHVSPKESLRRWIKMNQLSVDDEILFDVLSHAFSKYTFFKISAHEKDVVNSEELKSHIEEFYGLLSPSRKRDRKNKENQYDGGAKIFFYRRGNGSPKSC